MKHVMLTKGSDRALWLQDTRCGLMRKSSFCWVLGESLKRTYSQRLNFHKTLFVTHHKIYHNTVYCCWGHSFILKGFCETISPRSSLKKWRHFLSAHPNACDLQYAAQLSEWELSLHPGVMIWAAIWRLPLTEVRPVLYEQLFSTIKDEHLKHTVQWAKKPQTTSAMLPDNNQRACFQRLILKSEFSRQMSHFKSKYGATSVWTSPRSFCNKLTVLDFSL